MALTCSILLGAEALRLELVGLGLQHDLDEVRVDDRRVEVGHDGADDGREQADHDTRAERATVAEALGWGNGGTAFLRAEHDERDGDGETGDHLDVLGGC